MKVLFINTSDSTGGAAIAAIRLMGALNANGISADMIVMNKNSRNAHVHVAGCRVSRFFAFLFERIIIWINNLFCRKNLFKVSIANTGQNIVSSTVFKEADIIHLHWINQGMVSLREIERIIHSGKPVVWTMHDMWECTSICHHAYGCNKFKEGCNACKFLKFPYSKDISYRVFRKKLKILRNSNIHFVAVSSWLKAQAEQSALLKGCNITVIPNTLPVSEFKPHNKMQCRKSYGLPLDGKIIIFGAARIDDPIKGFNLLVESLKHIVNAYPEEKSRLHLLMFGSIKQKDFLKQIPIPYTHVGSVSGATELSKLYSAADVAVSASYYETFGQTLVEAQACGCIPVSFGNSGQSDIIIHKANGYLAEYLSTEDLANGISWALEHGNCISNEYLRNTVKERYDIEIVANTYSNLYTTLIEQAK